MVFYKQFQTINTKIPITKHEARDMIAEHYCERNANRLMKTLLREKSFGLGYWILFYEPTPETYCFEQGCESDPENCGYFPRQCIETKYGTVKTDGN